MAPFQSKPHYDILDGLRGVAALLVIAYHVFECFDWSPVPHGYLAVDFFFVLSGFVIGYAYDSRWREGLTVGGFFKRRLVRLHPMVIAGAVIGAVCFMIQGSVRWDGTHVSTGWVMVAMLLGMLLLPLYPGAPADVRGNGELFPLNGPSWSLFFEYIGNILYALLLRRLPTRWLAAVAAVSGIGLAGIALHDGYLGVGWSMVDGGLWTGLVRMVFPYTMGMLMARCFRPLAGVRGAFWICGVVIVSVGLLPLAFSGMQPWLNGLYDALCVIVVFPLLVWVGASQLSTSAMTHRVSHFLGALSYPLYAVHYPLMYLFYAHIGFDGNLVAIGKMAEVWPVALALPAVSIALAWMCLRCYDLPVRRYLMKAIMMTQHSPSSANSDESM